MIVGRGLKHLYDIQVDGEVIEATYNHPFWVVELQTFVWARDLVPGEHLLLADGRAPPITAISHHDEITTVYNLSIAHVHTFFVGARSVLVHNSCGGAEAVWKGQAGEKAVRDAYDIGEKVAVAINGRTRIFDGLSDEALSEVKNVAQQSFSRQLRDGVDLAMQRGLPFNLFTRATTKLSGPLKEAAARGLLNIEGFL